PRPPWPAPPSGAWRPQSWPLAPLGVPTRQAVHPLDGCPRPPPLPRPVGTPPSPRPLSPHAGAPLPSSYTHNSSPCDATHCPGFSCHRSTRCPASPSLLLSPDAPRAQRHLGTPPDVAYGNR